MLSSINFIFLFAVLSLFKANDVYAMDHEEKMVDEEEKFVCGHCIVDSGLGAVVGEVQDPGHVFVVPRAQIDNSGSLSGLVHPEHRVSSLYLRNICEDGLHGEIKNAASSFLKDGHPEIRTQVVYIPPDEDFLYKKNYDKINNILNYDIKKNIIFDDIASKKFIKGNIQSFLSLLNNNLFYGGFGNFSRFRLNLVLGLENLLLPINRNILFVPVTGGDGQTVDTENVMRVERINKTRQGIQHIYNLLKDIKIDEELCIQELQQYLDYLLKSDSGSVYVRSSNGMNEISNARLVLEGEASGYSYSSILDGRAYTTLDDETPVTIKSLLAKSWWLISNQVTGREQEILKETLIKSLGQCIEDDGHRVCDTGKSQRIVTALQGYIEGITIDNFMVVPEPESFLSAFFTPKYKEIQDVMTQGSEEQYLYSVKILDELKEQAKNIYQQMNDKIQKTIELTKNFIKYTFDLNKEI